MRMRTHIDALARREFDGTEVIEKDERTDHAMTGTRQDTIDTKPVAQVVRIAFDDDHDGCLKTEA
jgi:hypothetical protein